MCWKTTRKTVFHFAKEVGGKMIPLRVYIVNKVRGKGVETQFDTVFQITSPLNPLPIKGEFHSSVKVLFTWLKEDGWYQIPHTDTIIFN